MPRISRKFWEISLCRFEEKIQLINEIIPIYIAKTLISHKNVFIISANCLSAENRLYNSQIYATFQNTKPTNFGVRIFLREWGT